MAHAHLDATAIADWNSLHDACAKEFGFPSFYGRNGNAWIDCMSYIDEGDGMSRFVLQPGELLTIEISESEIFSKRAPELLAALTDWTECVNSRFTERGQPPRLHLLLL